MSAENLTVAVIGAGGKMGLRVSANLQKSAHTVFYSENSPAGQERVRAEGREISSTEDAIKDADVVILAVPDTVLGVVSQGVVPQMKSGAILLTLEPAAADAGLLAKRLAPWPNSPEGCEPAGKVRRPRGLPANSRARARTGQMVRGALAR